MLYQHIIAQNHHAPSATRSTGRLAGVRGPPVGQENHPALAKSSASSVTPTVPRVGISSGERPPGGVSRKARRSPSCRPPPMISPRSLIAVATSSTQPEPGGIRSLRSRLGEPDDRDAVEPGTGLADDVAVAVDGVRHGAELARRRAEVGHHPVLPGEGVAQEALRVGDFGRADRAAEGIDVQRLRPGASERPEVVDPGAQPERRPRQPEEGAFADAGDLSENPRILNSDYITIKELPARRGCSPARPRAGRRGRRPGAGGPGASPARPTR